MLNSFLLGDTPQLSGSNDVNTPKGSSSAVRLRLTGRKAMVEVVCQRQEIGKVRCYGAPVCDDSGGFS